MNQINVNEIIGRVRGKKASQQDLIVIKKALTSYEELIDAKEIEKEDLLTVGVEMGNRLKTERKKLNLTQSDLRKKSKVSQATISKIEKAKKIMTIEEAKKLAKALNITAEYLIAG